MIPSKIIREVINYLYQEAKDYAKLGGTNESWGLVHGAKRLEKALKASHETTEKTNSLIFEITKLEIIEKEKDEITNSKSSNRGD